MNTNKAYFINNDKDGLRFMLDVKELRDKVKPR